MNPFALRAPKGPLSFHPMVTGIAFGALVIGSVLGCSRQSPPKMAESAASAAPQPLPAQAEGPSQIRVSDDIRQACKDYDLPRAHFEFDSANLRQNYARELNGIVQCFTTGPLAGRKLIVVGHADPRGSSEYNLALGGQRAESVKEHFKQAGLPDARILTSSRGELDARGTDEQSWYQDRRVDLKLDGSS